MIEGQTREHSDIWSPELITRTLHYMLFVMVRLISFAEHWFCCAEISVWSSCRDSFWVWERIPVCTGLLSLTRLPSKSRAHSVGRLRLNIKPCLHLLAAKASLAFTCWAFIHSLSPFIRFPLFFSRNFRFKAPFSLKEKNNSTTRRKLLILAWEEGFLSFIMMLMMMIIIVWKKVVKKREFVITV